MRAFTPAGEPAAVSSAATLRRLFLTLFLRGRGARGLRRERAPKSVGQKLGLTLVFYTLAGALALGLVRQPVFALSLYLHAMTLMFLGMFVASSSGEVLFNQEEADILLHRPIEPRVLLWAKVRVLVEVSLWLALAFNLVGFFAGLASPDGGWRFLAAHAVSTALEALFCTGVVVLGYQLCLRWFGRERLGGIMTTAQVLISVAVVVSGQIVPRMMFHSREVIRLGARTWWIGLLPPAWFAGFDDGLAGSGAMSSWLLGGLAVAATAAVLWTAFGRLAGTYEEGLLALNETAATKVRPRGRRRWPGGFVSAPPLCWWFRDPVARGSFVLTAAYLFRDRDVRLRLYPGVAPMLIMPFFIMFRGHGSGGFEHSGFGVAFASSYLGLIPLLGMNLLQYSQQWQASDIFCIAPTAGPAPICRGARGAIFCFLTLPMLVVFAVAIWLFQRGTPDWVLALPGILALPIYALVPNLGGKGVPFSSPTEEVTSARRSLIMIPVLIVSGIISGLAAWARMGGWFWWYLAAEFAVVAIAYGWMSRSINAAPWPSME